ncbi:RNaseH domain-containing protein [Deinococcus marmoris]|uniref:RNaseH domain-containing protein n=1 Tax=Deinococcus marmoris TaxID=249408 RepID=UPI0004959CDE|nr:RNaseH domain-containing protein [Deinococcus marmoris]
MVNSTSPTAARVCPQLTQEDSAAPDAHDVLPAPCAGPLAPGQITPLGLILPGGVTLATPPLHVLVWQPQAAEALGRVGVLLQNTLLRPGALPTRSLAALAELHIPGLQRLDHRMGTAYGDQKAELAWSNEPDRNRLMEGTMVMVERWITGSLNEIGQVYADNTALKRALEDFRNLHACGALFAVQTLPGKVYSWGTHPNGTARNGHPSSYPALADAVAGALHGHELLPGHGVMRRVIPRHGQGRAELIGEPFWEADGQASSLALRVRVLSLPGLSRPLIALEAYRKCWETAPDPQPGHVTGYVLGAEAGLSAHAFTVSAKASPRSVNCEYRELARVYGLNTRAGAAKQRGARAQVVIQQRDQGGQRVTASVPVHDQGAVLRGAAALLAPLGLTPWTGVRELGALPNAGTLPEVVLGFTALPLGGTWGALVFRVWTHSGDVEARVAFDALNTPHQPEFSPWEPLPLALNRLAGTQPMALNAGTGQARFQRFVEQTVQGELEEGRAPLVTVDSTHAVRLWPWLADCRINPEHISCEQLGQRDLQVAWGRAGVRLVRLRQHNAPPLAVDGPGLRLHQVHDTTVPTYLACGITSSPGAHAAHPVELSVLLTQPGDGLDQLAWFVGGLLGGSATYGGGPILPTPLCP